MDDDIRAIKKWVKRGGVLAVLANDAPNSEFTHLNRLMKNFGMQFNHVTLHPVPGTDFEMGASTSFEDHPVFKGVSKIYIKEVSDIRLSGKARPILTENGKVLIAEADYGKGYVFTIGDPWIYNEYLSYAVRWGEFHKWGLRNGITTRNGDDQCCGQPYIDLYLMDPSKTERIRDIKAWIDNIMATD